MVKLKSRFIQSFCKGFVTIALMCSTFFANAVIIESELTDLGGNSYQYDFNVINDDFVPGIEGISVYFDFSLFDNLAVIASPAGWDSLELQSVPFLFLDGVFDTLALTAPLLVMGDSLAGFSMTVDWLGGPSGPAAGGNDFEIYDGFTFDVLASGQTTGIVTPPPPPPPNPNPIPEPGLLSLFGLALLFVGARKRLS